MLVHDGMLYTNSVDANRDRGPGCKPGLLDIVETAWNMVLPGTLNQTLTWEEAGGDSLKTLSLLLHLEKQLGRRLSFDAFDGTMTSTTLAQSLANIPDKSDNGTKPTIFLVPGLFGDEPILAGFRRSLAEVVEFETVELSDISAPREVLTDLHKVACAAAADIELHQPRGDIFVAGYSFGGRVAFEIVHQLRNAGRTVAFLGLLDAGFGRSDIGWRPRWMSRRLAIIVAIAASSDFCREVMIRWVRRFWPEKLVNFRRHLLRTYRTRFNTVWSPPPVYDLPTLLVFTQETPSSTVERWTALCPDAQIMSLPALHRTMFDPASLQLLAPRFAEAVQASADKGAGDVDKTGFLAQLA